MAIKELKREVRTEKITYPDGTVLHIKRVARARLADLWELQQIVLKLYVESTYSLAALMMDDECVACMQTILEMLPTVEGKIVDFTEIEDDYEQLGRLFCTKSYQDDGTVEPLTPCIISSLHHFDYVGVVGKLIDTESLRREQEKLNSDQV
jgi:hypothetical protein